MKKEKWTTAALGDVCDIYQPKTITSSQILVSGPFKVYGANGVIGFFDQYNQEESEVTITCRGATCGTVNVTEPKSWVTGNAMVIHSKDSRVLEKNFLAYLLRGKDLSRVITGAAQPQITRTSLSPFRIPLPPLEIQQEIVITLDAANNLKQKREEADKKMASLAPALFHKMFGDPVKNEKGWSVKKLNDICSMVNGKAFKQSEWSDSGLPIIRIQNLNDSAKPFNYFDGPLPDKYKVRHGDILFSWSGTPGTSFACFRWGGGDGWLNQHIFRVSLNTDFVKSDYFIFWLNSQLKLLIGKAHGGVGLQHVTKGELDKLSLPLPSIDFQDQFSESISKFRKLQEKQSISREWLNNVFEGVVSESFGVS